ncbi:response regulator transcription factor [Microbacterium arborescens]|uniref:response regulator transcription factor n=1 Tax=Microbacterium arborescens TaxID=33883 RepID=UPI003C75E622
MIRLLSSRELEVLGAIGQGLPNPEIAKQLALSESAEKTQVGRVLAKFELRDRIQAVVPVHRAGLVQR